VPSTPHYQVLAINFNPDPQDNLLGDLASACASGEMEKFSTQAIMIILFIAGGRIHGWALIDALVTVSAKEASFHSVVTTARHVEMRWHRLGASAQISGICGT
jgi:hypothetical protein